MNTKEIEERIEELEAAEADLDAAKEAATTADTFEDQQLADAALASEEFHFDDDDRKELKHLLEFRSELEGYCDWIHGETLIHKDDREAYAKEMVEDPTDAWPFNHIDWEAAAEEFFGSDYFTYADLNGETYYVLLS
jgi:hypothetical protein